MDRGGEIFNAHFTKVANNASIKMYATQNYDTKSVVMGRFLPDSLTGSVVLKNENRVITRVPAGNYFVV